MSRSGPGPDLDRTPGPGPGPKNSGPGPEVRVRGPQKVPGPDLDRTLDSLSVTVTILTCLTTIHQRQTHVRPAQEIATGSQNTCSIIFTASAMIKRTVSLGGRRRRWLKSRPTVTKSVCMPSSRLCSLCHWRRESREASTCVLVSLVITLLTLSGTLDANH